MHRVVSKGKQGAYLRDLRRPLKGVIFRDLWLNWTHFGSLTEDNPDFFKQICRGCFGLHLASEAESELAIDFFMASNFFNTNFQVLILVHWPSFSSLIQLCEIKEERLRLLDLRLEIRR